MAAVTHDQLYPRPPGGMAQGAAMALLAHAAMFLALTTVVQWRASPPETVVAELWSSVPQMAPPPPPPAAEPQPAPVPPTPPTPSPPRPEPRAEPALPDPQIAIAQARAEKERQRREREAEAKAAEKARSEQRAQAEARRREQLAREQKAEDERLAQQRQKNLERLMGQAGSAGGVPGGVPGGVAGGVVGATGTHNAAPSAAYAGRLIAAIKPNIVFTEPISGNPAAEVEVRTGPSGSILARRLVRSSGNKDWDEAVLRAIDRTATLPRDADGRVPPVLTISFRPQE